MADRKITDLTALAAGSQATGDLVTVVDVSEAAAADKNKKMTMENLFKGIPSSVGIGTASPGAALDVVGNSTMLRLYDGTNTSTGKFSQSGDVITLSQAGTAAGALAFATGSGALGSERMRIDGDGRLLVGTTSSIESNSVIQAVDASNSTIIIGNTSTSASGEVVINLAPSNSITGGQIKCIAEEDFSTGANRTASLEFRTRKDGTFIEAMRIDSSGNLGVGLTSLSASGFSKTIRIKSSTGAAGFFAEASDSSSWLGLYGGTSTSDSAALLYPNTGSLRIGSTSVVGTAGFSEKLRIDSSGRVGIGATSLTRNLTVQDSSTIVAAALVSNPSNIAYLLFGDTDADAQGRVQYDNSNDSLQLYSNGLERLRIDSSGNTGIGTAAPTSGNAGSRFIHIHNTASTGDRASEIVFTNGSTGTTGGSGGIVTYFQDDLYMWNYEAQDLIFGTSATERMRVDSSGRLLVGTSSARSNFFNTSTQTASFQVEGNDNNTATLSITANTTANANSPQLIFAKSAGSSVGSNTLVGSGVNVGRLVFSGNDGSEFVNAGEIRCDVDGTPGANDMPGRLVFSTTADGASSPTERMRIASAGTCAHFATNDTVLGANSNAASGTTYRLFSGSYNATGVFTGVESVRIWNNGNVQNANNSYGAISDAKLKENIVDASSQWDDIKDLRVRNYNFIEGQTHTQLGVVAQEVETVSPGLVTESPDLDEEGNDLGTVTKSVNYSVLYMKAVKALQEAMDRIETLEAKVAALEAQ